jgi:hypothetical protein
MATFADPLPERAFMGGSKAAEKTSGLSGSFISITTPSPGSKPFARHPFGTGRIALRHDFGLATAVTSIYPHDTHQS